MKSHGILALFLLAGTLAFGQSGQNWVKSNPVWHYDYFSTPFFGFEKIEQQGDTLIDGKLCQRYITVRHGFYILGPNGGYGHFAENAPDKFLYYANDTVFMRHNDQFHVLYDFTAQAGDSWLLSSVGGYGCNDSSYTSVDSTGIVDLGSETTGLLYMHSAEGNSLLLSGKVNTRFGAMQRHLFPEYTNCDSVIMEWPIYTFRCFQDDSLFYNPSGEDCEYMLTHLGLEDAYLPSISIYPNPSSEYVIVETVAKNNQFVLMDIAGRKVRSGQTENGAAVIDVRDLPEGLYVLGLELDGVISEVRKLTVKH